MKTSAFCRTCCSAFVLDQDPGGRAPCPSCATPLDLLTTCDVFISFASQDLTHARSLAAAFNLAAISYWLAPDRVGLGESFLKEIDRALAEAKVVVLVLSRNAIESRWIESEITQARSNGTLILPLKIEEFEIPRPFRLLLSHHQWEDAFGAFESTAGRVVERVQAELRRQAARPLAPSREEPAAIRIGPPPLEGVNPEVSPYVGPRPFPARMADRFFGRQHESEALLKIVAQSRVTLLYAPSGAGKSSLLNTVIAQSLEDQGFDVMLDARVGGALPADIKAADIRNVFSYAAICGLDPTSAPSPQWRLMDCLAAIRRRPGTQARVLVFDQFEEIFTQHRERFEDRAQFFEELGAALRSDQGLRVLISMRQEYLADLDPLAAALPAEFGMKRMALRRLGPEGALEAIVRPAARYATFGADVAEAIVWQLNTIKVPGFDQVLVEKRGEFIEMVHLQIVCTQLWRRLPTGITSIEMSHVHDAAGEGQTFNEFVVNALNVFYDDTIAKVVRSPATIARGGYSKELIRLGMMKFVTPAATRTMVPRAHGRVGRLPDWIIEQLENEHLIRFEERGGQRWYELSHDRLAGPVGRQMNRQVSSLLFAADLLDKVLENALLENKDGLSGYFEEHRDVLAECRPFRSQVGLFLDEAEFVFRASIKAGRDMREWSRRVAQDFPEVRSVVLKDAVSAAPADVRRHAVEILGLEPLPGLSEDVVEMALTDPDDSVRQTAGTTLALIDQQDLYRRLVDELPNPRRRSGALEALARIRIAADGPVDAPSFERAFAMMPIRRRAKIRHHARTLRLRENLAVLAFVFVPAVTLAAAAAALFKWMPATLNWSVTQATPSFAMGIFQGIVAGVIWGGLITVGITLFHVVFGNEHQPRSMWRPVGAIVAGAISGLASSAVVVFLVIGVFDPGALQNMGWLVQKDSGRFTGAFLSDIFFRTKFGWVDLVTGTGLGIGMALVTNALKASARWTHFLDQQRALAGFDHVLIVAREIAEITLPKAWPLPLVMVLAAGVAFQVPDFGASSVPMKANATALIQGLFADCATQTIGAFFAVVGMGLGIVVMRCGFRVEPRKNQG